MLSQTRNDFILLDAFLREEFGGIAWFNLHRSHAFYPMEWLLLPLFSADDFREMTFSCCEKGNVAIISQESVSRTLNHRWRVRVNVEHSLCKLIL
jgi:hypothetical protein